MPNTLLTAREHAHSFVHSNLPSFLKVFKNSKHLLQDLETNLFRAAIFPFRLKSCFKLVGDFISRLAWIFLGFVTIPH